MAFLTAEKIHNGLGWLPQGTVIEVAEDGTILSIGDRQNEDTVTYEGILTPGFVNVHCHLELSHMRGAVPEHTGLIPFLGKIPTYRNSFTDEQKKNARHAGYHELLQNGVVAVGDIANTTDTLDLRALDKLHYHTFVESIGFSEVNAERSFGFAKQTYDAFLAQKERTKKLRQSIVPHAPYSVSSTLFRLIDAHNNGATLTIHNQESEEENKYYTRKEGNIPHLLHSLGVDDSFFIPPGKSSLQSYLQWMNGRYPLVFVHNTYTTREDVQFAHKNNKEAYWCLCPNANLYIENRLPDIDMFRSENAKICIGTDSLASNPQLCIVSELYSIKERFPHLDWETLFTWATHNGAQALQMQDTIGTIEAGKKPGIVQVLGLDKELKPTAKKVGLH